jgi:hypothetical protein
MVRQGILVNGVYRGLTVSQVPKVQEVSTVRKGSKVFQVWPVLVAFRELRGRLGRKECRAILV